MRTRKKRRKARPVIFARTIQITAAEASVFVHAEKPRGLPPELSGSRYLVLQGRTDEPLRGVHDFSFHLGVDDRKEPAPVVPPSIGAIIQVRPQVSAVIGVHGADFDRLWCLAASGHLSYSHLAFTAPRYGRAFIVSASFSNTLEE